MFGAGSWLRSPACKACGHGIWRGKVRHYKIRYCTHCGLRFDEIGYDQFGRRNKQLAKIEARISCRKSLYTKARAIQKPKEVFLSHFKGDARVQKLKKSLTGGNVFTFPIFQRP